LDANPDDDEFAYHAYDERTGLFYWFPIAQLNKVEVDQNAIVASVKQLDYSWQAGQFERSFSSLAAEAAGLEAEDLGKVEDIISERLAKSSEEFEAFGMKFPLAQIAVWGIVSVLSVQLYFFVYLRELAGKLSSDDPGWDVPWVCMDQSSMGKSIFFVTAILLPVATMLLLCARASLRLIAGYLAPSNLHAIIRLRDWDRAVIAELVVLFSVIVVAMVLGALSWACRPRLRSSTANPHCNSQLFE
jgi:hypothetical protein